ncbi:hypothetical protein [Dyella sp. 2HG41-7]|uniref:hypothetical protein n=1 Tax=Dyella sp. 2HG41-7 TaxID=2883239 RepID=UPI001F1CDE6B|nr:hypothetical protein [Dyella sp. 2HG41-7]
MATTTYQNSYFTARLCFLILSAVSLFTFTVSAQECKGNLDVGCLSPGATCNANGVQHGICTSSANLPKGERECTCKFAGNLPPVVLHPKYIIASLVYAPPGCAGATPGAKCGQTGLVDYSSGSSMGTKLGVTNSMKVGTQVTVDAGTQAEGASLSFGFTFSENETQTTTLTKSATYEVKDPGPNEDGVDHDQDMFIILINPTVTLKQESSGGINWSPGFSGQGAAPQNIWVSELRNPATMNPDKAKLLKDLGFTAEDFKTIRCMDPFAGPGVRNGPGGAVPDPCQELVNSNNSTAVGVNTRRYRATTEIIPYDPPPQNAGCPNEIYTIKNDYQTEGTQTDEEDYTVSGSLQGGIPVFSSLKVQNTMTWTTSTSDSTTKDTTQSLSYTAACPSANYNGPLDFTVYIDQLYGTFAFVPFDPTTMELIHQGMVTHNKKPVAGQAVTLQFAGHTFHTYTSARGKFVITRLKTTPLKGHPTGTLTVGKHKQTVTIGGNGVSDIQI